jgi:hypothetical protein
MPGNAPRYFSGLHTDGIHNVDLSIYKEFSPKESMKLQVRADIVNLVNHPRFAPPILPGILATASLASSVPPRSDTLRAKCNLGSDSNFDSETRGNSR